MDEQSKNTKSRRRFLKSAAKVAIYTPPAMMAVSNPSFATFAQSGGLVGEKLDGKQSKKKKKKYSVKKKSNKKSAKKKASKKKKVIT